MESFHLPVVVKEPIKLDPEAQLICHNDPFNPNDTTMLVVPIGALCSEVLKDFSYDIEYYDIIIAKNQEIMDVDFVIEEHDIVNFQLVPKGGGSGKQILMVVALIAVAIYAPYLAGQFMGATAGMVGAGVYGGVMGGAIFYGLTAAITIAGSMLISSLFKPSAPDVPSLQSFEQSTTYGWNTSGNTIAQGNSVPVLYGTTRITPQYIGKYLETVDDKQYLKILTALGEGPFDSITGVEINDSDILTYKDTAMDTRMGTNTQTVIADFNDTWVDQVVNKKLTGDTETDWIYAQTTGDSVNAITIGIVCPQGIFYANNSGGMSDYTIKIRVEYREVGSITWQNANYTAYNTQVYFVDQNPIAETAYYFWGGTYQRVIADSVGPYDVYSKGVPQYWGTTGSPVFVETITSLPLGVSKQVIYPPGSGLSNYSQCAWTNTINDSTGLPYFTVTENKSATVRRSYTIRDLPAASYEVRIRYEEMPNTTSRYGSTTYFEFLQEAITDDFIYPNTALLALDILATDQISGGLPKITCIASRITGEYGRLDNPAWACLDIIMNTRYGAGIPLSRIDFQSFQDWADYCTSENFTVNIYLDQNLTLVQTLQVLGQLGRGTVIQYGSTFSALVDKPSIVPTQGFLFSMGNIIQDSFTETFLPLKDRANIIEVTYYDLTNNYDRTAIEVSQGNYDLTNTVNKTSINLIGCVTKEQALRQAKYHLNQNRYLTITATWEASIDAIACKVGDIVNVAHDVPQWGWSGRILSNTIGTITIDRDDLVMEVGKTYYIQVSDANTDEQVYVPITSISGGILTTSSTLGALGEYSVYAFGEVNRHAKKMRILSISTAGDLKRKLTAIEYNSDAYNDTVTIPTPIVVQDLSTKDLVVSEYLYTTIDGRIETIVQLAWKGAKLSYDVSYKRIIDAVYTSVGSARSTTHEIKGLVEGEAYSFMVDGVTANYTIIGKTTPPPIISDLTGSESGNIFTLNWTYPYKPLDFKEFQIFDGLTKIGSTTTNRFTSGILLGAVSKTLTVYTIDTSGNVSNGVYIVIAVADVAPVTGLTGTESGNIFTLNWLYTKPEDFKHFNIYDGTTKLGDTTANTYTTKVLTSGSHVFKVIAEDTSGNVSVDNSIVVSTAVVAPVTGLTGNESGNIFTLNWLYTKPEDFKQYIIYHNDIKLGDTVAESFISPVLLGSTHVFTIEVVDTYGNTNNTPVSIEVPVAEIPVATLLFYTESGNIFSMTWSYLTRPEDFKQYIILKDGVNIGSSIVESFTTQAFTGVSPITLGVQVEDSAGNLSAITSILASVTPLAPVTNITITESGNIFTLNWVYTKPEDFKQYIIYDGATKLGVTTANTFTTKQLASGSRTFDVQVEDSAGNITSSTAIGSTAVVAPVTGLTGNESGNIFTATWSYTKPTDFKQYIIYDGTTKLGTTSAETFTTARILNVSSINITVVVEDTAGNISTEVVFNIPVNIVAPIIDLTGTESGNIFTLNWAYTKPEDFKHYKIFNGLIELGTTTTNTYTSDKLMEASISFNVFVEDTAGNVSSVANTIINVTPVPIPTGLAGSIALGKVNLTWFYASKPNDFSHYEVYVDDVYLGNSTTESYSGLLNNYVPGVKAFTVKAVDTATNKSTADSTNISIVGPTISTPIFTFVDNIVTLTWVSTKGSYNIDKFTVTIGTDTYTSATNSVVFPITWAGGRTATITSYDSAGNTTVNNSTNVLATVPGNPVVNSEISITSGVKFSWTAVAGSCGIKEYVVAYNGNQIITKDTHYFLPTTTQGSYSISVYAYDYIGIPSTLAGIAVANITNPLVSNINGATAIGDMTLTWDVVPGSFNIKDYVVTYTDGLSQSKTLVVTTKSATIIPNWVGIKTFSVTPRDLADNSGTTIQYNHTVVAPDTPAVTATIAANSVVFNISVTKRSFDIAHILMTYDAKTITVASTSPTVSIPVFWDLTKDFTFTVVDVLGNSSSSIVKSVTINEAIVTSVLAEVIDNNVLLRWSSTLGTLPIDRYIVAKGDVYSTALVIGSVAGTFNTVFESQSGDYTYWVTPVDTAGNEGVYSSARTRVSQPPDFILNANWVSDWSGTKTNIKYDSIINTNSVVLPVNTAINYQDHFTTYSWTTPNAQVVAGFPLWLTPSTTTASYLQTFDYGTLLGSTSITLVDPVITQAGTGAYTMTRQISTSPDNSVWTAAAVDSMQVYITNIRYVRVVYNWTVSTTALLNVGAFSLRLDAKIKNDSGSGYSTPSITTTAITGNGTNGTATFAAQPVAPYKAGDKIQIADAVPTSWNGVWTVVSSTTTNTIFANTTVTTATTQGTINAGGALVYFNTPFVDITAISVTPSGTTPLIAMYDFVDAVNPTYFKVLLYTTAGVRANGSFSWATRGY